MTRKHCGIRLNPGGNGIHCFCYYFPILFQIMTSSAIFRIEGNISIKCISWIWNIGYACCIVMKKMPCYHGECIFNNLFGLIMVLILPCYPESWK